MANGGVIAPVGMNMVALAAQKHAVPFVVVAGIHKVSELYYLYILLPPFKFVCLSFLLSLFQNEFLFPFLATS